MATQTKQESIPQDIIIQIFSWLPIKSLMRFKCVSKFYNSLVLERNFGDLHLSHYFKISRGDTKFIARVKDVCYAIEEHDEDGSATMHQTECFNKLYDHINGPPDEYQDHFMCDNGLCCIWDVTYNAMGDVFLKYIAIYNPTTREVRFLPHLKDFEPTSFTYYICSIGFEPKENKYKVLLVINFSIELSRAWVFTLGIDKSWREIKFEHGYDIPPYRSGICISGIIYRFGGAPESCIAAFDVKSEIFRSIPTCRELVNTLDVSKYDYMLIEVEGKIAILEFLDFWFTEDIHLWIFGETRKDEWEHHIFRFPLGSEGIYLRSHRIRKYRGEEIVFAMNITANDVLVCFCYDVKKKSWRHFEVQGSPVSVGSICIYAESLFSLENIGSTHHQVQLQGN
ncbi:F-box only protein 8-like [Lycium barbarum]|uniref:F-box only protein 8-like n=1 Tax=Lycium barbarum TaxID=112863 RepID=UPI00293EE549|nr:F-box only protein 8-like [Lycium barbarum]